MLTRAIPRLAFVPPWFAAREIIGLPLPNQNQI
jgi:hypothetical protein